MINTSTMSNYVYFYCVNIYQLVRSLSRYLYLSLASHLCFQSFNRISLFTLLLSLSLSVYRLLCTLYMKIHRKYFMAFDYSAILAPSPLSLLFFLLLLLVYSFTPYVTPLCNCRSALLGSVFVIYQLQMWGMEMGKKA